MVNLGDKVKDEVTGLIGIAVASISYLQGCNRIAIQAPVKKNEKPQDWHYVDEPQLKIIKRNVVKQARKVTKKEKPGGYKPDNAQRKNPKLR